ncbi:PQQ-dependent sugar dehydrogenase [Actinomadura geliboluensis]|uniref:PQQ-dependent sugar dehydrogenase n=1 Tax=Actinomadura geliboluensis TaxID=882440 RepID=A0A5S4H423_9ACTN|nr:PQQ-dependent sugar dehydrogenase [Actinomadura geliboluensis]TMR39995.1 PQQ-dependent sugar dehydrogenase [Actinomadura geliboluensis]
MRLHTIVLVSTAVLLAGCSSSSSGGGDDGGGRTSPPVSSGAPSGTPGAPGEPRTIAADLEVPWAVAFLPGGDALVTERDSGRVVRVAPSGQKTVVGTVPGVEAQSEAGLLGVAVSPSYASDHLVYLYYTAAADNRVVRATYDGRLGTPEPIVTGIPKGPNHDGGRLAFGPDKMLYIATGETGDGPLAQDKNSLAGKILRVTPDGKPAPGNPFGNRVWTYGHRNVQGLAWDGKGRLYATEFGQNRFDEINLIQKGKNYGWPEVEGDEDGDGFTKPLLTWTTDEASPSGLAYADGSLWAAALRGERLWQVPLNNGKVGRPVAHLQNEFGRLRAVTKAPDGTLWVTTSNRDGRGDPAPNDDRILSVHPG